MGQYIRTMTDELANAIRFRDMEKVRELSENNELATAKIMLSLVRRIGYSYVFFAEGRVTFDDGEAITRQIAGE
jgi:hypothetical protein